MKERLIVCNALHAVGSMLQVVLHSWIASLLFLWIGEMYEVQGSRCAMQYSHTGRSTTTILILMLANSAMHPLVLMPWLVLSVYIHTLVPLDL